MPDDSTPNLGLPYIAAAQAQKHVTHNEAIRALDALVQIGVVDRDLSAPPGTPADGDCYIVAGSATGAWAGHDGEVAAFQDGAWMFYPPQTGWLAWVADDGGLFAWDGGQWVVAGGSGGAVALNPASGDVVGINTTADATNRLAVKSDASLFSHDDVTPGSGDHQIKINKASATQTASQLFQSGFSGRAEFGLAGSDDFSVKVSPDGANWFDALVADRTTGRVAFPNTAIREQLTGNRTYFVRTDGNDANDGLTNASGGAFATIQKAIDVVASIDIGPHNVTIKLADGTHTQPNVTIVRGPWVGSGVVVLEGNMTNSENVVVTRANGNLFQVVSGGRLFIRGFEANVAGPAGSLFQVTQSSVLTVGPGMRFGSVGYAHLQPSAGGYVTGRAPYEVTGGGTMHIMCSYAGLFDIGGQSITVSNTPHFTQAFCFADRLSNVLMVNNTYIGGATGKRYGVDRNAVLTIGGATLPGDVAGTIQRGGIVV